MSRDTGGAAFPETHVHAIKDEAGDIREGWYGSAGMSLRDYFAAKVACGLIANYGMLDEKDVAIKSYRIADAMLAHRNNQ